jgi:ribosome-associated toxin RatA of RatAB toxin-antitoxin module
VETHISRRVHAEPATIFALAAAVENWPRILPHYRWVRVLGQDTPDRRTVEMAARRDVLGSAGFPLWWTAIETVDPVSYTIEFEHVRGVTRGMRVAWTIAGAAADAGVEVAIRHVFNPRWPVPDRLVHELVGEYFVNGVARRTLRLIGELAETRTKDA